MIPGLMNGGDRLGTFTGLSPYITWFVHSNYIYVGLYMSLVYMSFLFLYS